MIRSAVFATAVALQTTFHSPEKFWEILGRFIERLLRAAQRVPGSRMQPSEPGLRNTGRHELDRQSQPNRWGCHSLEMKDQLFTFCRRFGTASIFSTVFSMHSIGFLLRATEPKWKSALKYRDYVALQVQGSSERQYTAAGGDVQVPRGNIYVWKAERKEIDTRIGQTNTVWVSFIALWPQNGSFKHRKAVSFQIDLCSDPYLWSWILGNDRNNINSGASTKDGIFAKSPRCQRGVPRLDCVRGK